MAARRPGSGSALAPGGWNTVAIGEDTTGVRVRAINLAEGAGRSAGEREQREAVREVPRTGEMGVATIAERLKRELGPEQFERHFGGQTRLAVAAGVLKIIVPSGYQADLIERRFGEQVRRVLETLGKPLRPEFSVERAVQPPTLPGRATPIVKPAPAAPKTGDAVRMTFDGFVVGRANRLAYSAAVRLAEDETPVPPIFVHGTCGLGKSHLLRAAAGRFTERRPGALVRYVTAEAFTNEFIQAVRANRVDQFRRTYRRVDLLCVDDVHFFAGKDATQTELLHTLDAVQIDGARLLLASDEHPKEIAKLSERLVSRFMAGAVVKIDVPDPELREKLVRHLAERRGLRVDEPALRLIADRSARAVGSLGGFGGSVREIEGLLNQVDAVHRLLPEVGSNGVIGVGTVRRALGLDDQPGGHGAAGAGRLRRPVAAETVITEVCRELSVDLPDFMGKGRHKRVVLARSLVASMCRRLTTMSFPEIARSMGRSNHSTIITAQRRIDRQLAEDTGKPLSAELAAGHAGSTLRELAAFLSKKVQSG
jgi:chromosomal replication initiator protein